MNHESLFSSCNTEREIMEKLFDLAATQKYPRPELLGLANSRRAQLKGTSNEKLEVVKMLVDTSKTEQMNSDAAKCLIINSSSMSSKAFRFLANGKYAF